MKQVLDEIQNGKFAKEWIAENENGAPKFKAERAKEHEQLLENVGRKLRQMMPFLDPVTTRPGD
jgi:ketol-acid reductoisomerase